MDPAPATPDRGYWDQPFGDAGVILCLVCTKPIADKDFYLQVRQRCCRAGLGIDNVLLVHVRCLGGLPK